MNRALIGAPRNNRGQLTRTEKNLTLDALHRGPVEQSGWVSHGEATKRGHRRAEKRLIQAALASMLVSASFAQPALSVGADAAQYAPGAAVTLTVALSGSTNALGSPINLQFQLGHQGLVTNAANVTIADPAKSSICYDRDPATLFCVVFGISGTAANDAPLPNGALVTIPATVAAGTPAGPLVLTLTQTDGTTTDATSTTALDAPVSGTGTTITILPGACDVNGDGKVDYQDVQAAALALARNQPGSIKWGLTLLNVARVLQAAITGICTVQ